MTLKSYIIRPVRINIVADGTGKRFAEKPMTTPSEWAEVAMHFARNDGKERFIVGLVDARHYLVAVNIVSVGTLTSSLVHPREVFRTAIVHGAAGILLAHNHPSGDVTPSSEDRETTRRLEQAGKMLGISILDHVIVAEGKQPFSFRQAGGLDTL